jgi:hypothetical protein
MRASTRPTSFKATGLADLRSKGGSMNRSHSERKAAPLYVQYGCGPGDVPASWVNFDASPTLRLQQLPAIGRLISRKVAFSGQARYGDIVRGLPLAAESVDGMYCSHVLEHLTRNEMQTALRNTFTVLRPGAPFRLVLPDLETLARKYATGVYDADTFVAELGMGAENAGLRSRIRLAIGNTRHQWMWDESSLSLALKQAGFEGVRRADLGDSGQAWFEDVEDPTRWDGCLGLHCIRPKQ